MDTETIVRPIIRIPLLGATVLSLLGLTIYSHFASSAREENRELMRFGMEDVAGRVWKTTENLKLVRKFNDAAALAKARAFARIVAADSSIITNQPLLDATAKMLDVDEVHVSDERGVLIGCVPSMYVGFDMGTTAQTRPFTAALTDPDFELAQDPMPKGEDKNIYGATLFQYAGVARIDRPGIVQVGQRASRVEQAQKLADVAEIQKTARIGSRGRVTIRPADGMPPIRDGYWNGRDENLNPIVCLEADCAGYRIIVSMPKSNRLLASEWSFRILLAFDLALLALWLVMVPRFRRVFLEDLTALRTLFGGSGRKAFFRTVTSPVALACMAAFALAVAACWLVSSKMARNNAEDLLMAAALDMRKAFDSSVDLLLFYQGNAICGHYKSPENMTSEAVMKTMNRYGIDELNVVNGEGRVVVGSLTQVGYDMASNPQTAAFNCLLNGERTFSQPFRGAVEDPTIRRKYAGIAFPPPAKGYIQIGFSEERAKDGIDYWFADQAADWHVGESGFYVIAKDETGIIDSCGFEDEHGNPGFTPGETLASIGFDATRAPRGANEFFTAKLFGRDCLCLTEIRTYHRIITALPLKEVNGGATRIVLATTVVLLVMLALVGIFMTRLSDLVAKLRSFIDAEKDRQIKDLTLAKTIQTSALPIVFPNEPDFRIFAKMLTAREVGGDFYDFYERPDGKLVFLVADVSGKGVPAALFMMRAKAQLRAAVLERPDSISGAIRIANDALADHNDAEMFVTAWIGVYDRHTGIIAYVNAGHNPPLIRRADGSVEWIRTKSGLVLAAMSGISYRSGRCRLGVGDSLFLYTDGISEAMNTAGELYGEKRLEDALGRVGKKLVTDIDNDVAAFTAGAEQSDDITILTLDRLA